MKTVKLNPQFIKGEDGKPLGVFITVQEFNSIVEDLEELADLEAVEAYNKNPDKEFIPFEQTLKEIKNKDLS